MYKGGRIWKVFVKNGFSRQRWGKKKKAQKGRQITYEWVRSEAQARKELITQEEARDGTMT